MEFALTLEDQDHFLMWFHLLVLIIVAMLF